MRTKETILKEINMLEGKYNSLFERLDMYFELGDDNYVESFIQNNIEELIKTDPILLIGSHVDYYLQKEDIPSGLMILSQYMNRPYISMQCEDFMKELKDKIIQTTKRKEKEVSEEEILKNLLSNKEGQIVGAIQYLAKRNLRNYNKVIDLFFKSEAIYKFKALLLLALVEQKVDKEYEIDNNGLCYKVEPSILDLPFDTYPYIKIVEMIKEENLDPSLYRSVIELINMCEIKNYPNSLLDMDNLKLYKDIFIYLAQKYSQVKVDKLTIANKHDLFENTLNACIYQVEEILKS